MTRAGRSQHLSDEGLVMLVGVASGLLYGATYFLQRSMSPLHATASFRTAAFLYFAVTVATFVCYAAIISLARVGAFRQERPRLIAFAFPILFTVALTVGRPHLSTDVLTYVAQGHQAAAGRNPYAEPVKALGDTRFGMDLTREGWRAVHDVSPYGPVWTEIESLIERVSYDVSTETLLVKLLISAFSLGSAVLIWLILGQAFPRHQALGTVLYLWNPVVIMEFGGEGHNDALVIFLILLSVYLWMRGRFGHSLVAIAVGALVKIIAALFVPLMLVYAWRTDQMRKRGRSAMLTGACGAAVIAVAAYAPFWIGAATFDGLIAHARPNLSSASTPSVLYWHLTRSHPEEAAARLLAILMMGSFVGYMAAASLRIRDTTTLLKACGRVAIVYLVVAPGYWPWYAAMPIAVLALAPTDAAVWAILAISLGSRLAAPVDVLRLNGLMTWEREVFTATILGVWFPALVIASLGAPAAVRAWIGWKSRHPAIGVWRSAPPTYVSRS
jgi:alpha-1,6-mannosyltransferase